MAFKPSKQVNGRMWPPGVSGTRMAAGWKPHNIFAWFLKDLADVWGDRGRAAMRGRQSISRLCSSRALPIGVERWIGMD